MAKLTSDRIVRRRLGPAAVIVVIVATAWYAISGLHVTPLPVLVALVPLLAAQHIWFAVAEARREAQSKPLPSPSPR
jgi:hypothetical protein